MINLQAIIFSHKTKRWYIKIAVHLLELALTNSYILYKKRINDRKVLSQYNYRLSVVKELITPWRTTKKLLGTEERTLKRKNMEGENSVFSSTECQLDKRPDNKKKYCKLCSKSEDASSQTYYECKTCGVPVCVIKCYDLHRVQRRKRVKTNE